MNYLKTEVTINPGEVEQKAHARVIGTKPGYIVIIKVSNTAPVETSWPMIVFTGVSLIIGGNDSPQGWENHHHFKMDTSKAYPQDNLSGLTALLNKNKPLRGDQIPILTSNESSNGYSLFPGQSIVYEVGITGENKPNLKDLNYWLQGSLSRRHLFHTLKQIV
jgi:hypothetical protein